MSKQDKRFYEFGEFQIDADQRVLLRDGEFVPLTPKVFDILLVLVESRGRIVEKDEMMRLVWPDAVVEEGNLNRNISTLRKALGETPGESRYIETVPKRGYRFVAPVTDSAGEGEELIVASYTRSHIVSEEVDEGVGRSAPLALNGMRGGKASWMSNRPLLAAAALLVLLTGLISYLLIAGESRPVPPGAAPRSIAVLPFKPLSEDEGEESLGLGMADALITSLSRIREMSVRPTSAILRYDDPKQDPLAAGQELGVDSLLDGRIQRSGDRIRVTVQLVSVRDGRTLWAEKFDEQFTNIFAVQDSISEQVTRSLALELSGEEKQRLTRRHTHSPEAYDLYLKGRYLWNRRGQEGLRKSIEYFERAIEIDPSFALAYAGLADSYVLGGGLRLPAKEVMPRAKEAAVKALELDEQLAEAHASLGLVKMTYEWDLPGAEREFNRAIELNPNYATGRQWYADCLAVMGRLDDALREVEKARELDPLSLIINRDRGRILYFARQYDRAIEQLENTLDMNENFSAAHFTLGFVYAQKGLHENALERFQKSVSLLENRLPIKAALGYGYGISGNSAEARKVLGELAEASNRGAALDYELAIVHLGLGRNDEALERLEKAYEERSYRLLYVGVDPAFDGLRSDPRFIDLLRRIGLSV